MERLSIITERPDQFAPNDVSRPQTKDLLWQTETASIGQSVHLTSTLHDDEIKAQRVNQSIMVETRDRGSHASVINSGSITRGWYLQLTRHRLFTRRVAYAFQNDVTLTCGADRPAMESKGPYSDSDPTQEMTFKVQTLSLSEWRTCTTKGWTVKFVLSIL